jgi:hypothetical protein
MTHRNLFVITLVMLFTCSTAIGQEILDRPIMLEIGGSPGGGTWFMGGDDDTEVDYNIYTFSFYGDYYVTQKVALEGEYTFGVGMGQDITFRNGRIPGQQVPWTNDIMGRVLFFPRGTTGTRFPFYVGGGAGVLTLVSRNQTKKLGYDPDVTSSERFTVTSIGGGVKIPRRVTAPNWGFRVDYRFLFINSNESAPAFFAHSERRSGHHVQFGMQYAFRR